jgi:hypothetical protein
MDIDLNLNNYSIEDLKRLLGVSSNCTILEIEEKKQQLLDKLIKINANPQMQKDINYFLNQASDMVINQMDIIPKPKTPFIYSNPSTYFQGTFNPLEKRLISKTICIDTLFRSNYFNTKSTDFTYTFPETINNVVSMQIKTIEIPYSWYTISADKKNNSFLIIIEGETPLLITIPDGNYNTAPTFSPPLGVIPYPDIISVINTQLVASGIGITCNYDPAGNKISFTSDPLKEFTIDFVQNGETLSCTSPEGLSLGWILGFKQDIYTNETFYIGESTYKTSFTNYFFIDIDDFHNNHLTDAVISVVRTTKIGTPGNLGSPSYLGNNIMARIPVSGMYNSTIVKSTDCVLNKREYFGPVRLEKMNIRLLDRFGKVIDLNLNDYSFVVEVIQLYS